MNQLDTSKIVTSMGELYPYIHKDTSKVQLKAIVELWQKCFDDIPYEVVNNALLAFFATDTKGFAPRPGQLREIIANMSNDGGITEGQAWDMVRKAYSNSRYNAYEEFQKLPLDIQEAVGSYKTLMEWANRVSVEEFETVIYSQFLRSYRGKKEQTKNWSMLPENIRNFAIESAAGLKQIGKFQNGGEGDNGNASS